MKCWDEITVGDFNAMTPKQRMEYNKEWWLRATQEPTENGEPIYQIEHRKDKAAEYENQMLGGGLPL